MVKVLAEHLADLDFWYAPPNQQLRNHTAHVTLTQINHCTASPTTCLDCHLLFPRFQPLECSLLAAAMCLPQATPECAVNILGKPWVSRSIPPHVRTRPAVHVHALGT